MIKKTFASQLRINMASGVVITIITFAVTAISYPIYLHFLGYEKYGVWLVLSTVLTFAQLGNLGINSAITKIVAEEYGNNNMEAVQQYITVAIILLLLSGSMALIVILIFKTQIISAFKLSHDNSVLVSWLLPYIGVLSVYVFVVEACNSILSGLGRMDLANSAQATGRLTVLGVSSIMLYYGYGVSSLIIANFLSYFVINLQTVAHIRKIIGNTIVTIVPFNTILVKRLVRISSVVFVSSVVNMLLDPFNKIMLSRYAGVSAIPVYDLAFKGTMQIRGLIASALSAIMPEVSRLTAKIDLQAANRIVHINIRSLKLILLSGLFFFLPVYIFSGDILKLWLGKNFVPEVPFAFRVLLISVLISLLAVPAYHTLLGLGKVYHTMISHILVSFLNLSIVIWIVITNPLSLASNIYFAIIAGQCGSTMYLLWYQRKTLLTMIRYNSIFDRVETNDVISS